MRSFARSPRRGPWWPLVLVLSLGPACASSAPLAPRAVELNRLGAEALEQGDLSAAEARLSLALEFHPRFVEALVNLGLVELARGNHDRAQTLFLRARRINADLPHPHHGLGVLAHKQRRLQDAADHYRQALRVDPAFVPSRANLGRLLFDAGSIEEAREQFAKLVEAAPADGRGHAGLVEALRRLGRGDDADEALARAQREAPTSPSVRLLVARRALGEGHLDHAREELRRLADEHHDDQASARAWLAVAALIAGSPDEAIDQATRALALDRHDPVATYAMAAALEAKGDPAAASWRQRVDQTSPTTPRPR